MLELLSYVVDPLPESVLLEDRKLNLYAVYFPTSSSLPRVPQHVLCSSPEATFKKPYYHQPKYCPFCPQDLGVGEPGMSMIKLCALEESIRLGGNKLLLGLHPSSQIMLLE